MKNASKTVLTLPPLAKRSLQLRLAPSYRLRQAESLRRTQKYMQTLFFNYCATNK